MKKQRSVLGVPDFSLELMCGFAWESEPGRNRVNQSSGSSILLCCWAVQKGEKNCCDLSRFKSCPGSLPAPGRAQHCLLPLTQSRRGLPFLPLQGVLPAADKAGPCKHSLNVSSTGEEMLSAGKSHFPAPCTRITAMWTILWTYTDCFSSHYHVQLPLPS